MASSIDPLTKTYEHNIPAVSKKTFTIAGILTTVYGLEELPHRMSEVACLHLLHPRLCAQDSMEKFAAAAISHWNQTAQDSGRPGLIAIAFDQRNHGTRTIAPLANESWKTGNPSHAQDMFSIFQGTASDVSLLIDYLPAYVFPKSERYITSNLVLGVSLGGHAAWSCILHEPRIQGGVVIIGCPDYVNLMADRARLSKRPSWQDSSPPGSQFLGSEDFPVALHDAVRKKDPASLFLSHMNIPASNGPLREEALPLPSDEEKKALRETLTKCLAGKKIMNLSGGADKLVPYHRGEPLLTWLKNAIRPGGWFEDGSVSLEDIIFEGVGHEVSPTMVEQAVRFISEFSVKKDESEGPKKGRVRDFRL